MKKYKTRQKKLSTTKKRQLATRQKIRDAYSKPAPDNVTLIPATVGHKNSDGTVSKLRVAAYCRVSTQEIAQGMSIELQVQHFTSYIQSRSDWELVEIYSDEGISGTSMKKREALNRMLEDCKAGKIDFIVTKAVNRIARNTTDCLTMVRMLKTLNPPVGVFFETENLNTLETSNEFTLGVLSLVAQGESEQKSNSITWSFVERCKRGLPYCPTNSLLGYDTDDEGNIFIIEDEAVVVRRIYNSYLGGMSQVAIADELNEEGYTTVKGNTWSSAAIGNILSNERYCGDVLSRKTVTVDCLNHKVVKNEGIVDQYLIEGHHPAIVSKEKWKKAQQLRKYYLHHRSPPTPRVQKRFRPIKRGSLQGFIAFDPTWKKVSVARLVAASCRVCNPDPTLSIDELEAEFNETKSTTIMEPIGSES